MVMPEFEKTVCPCSKLLLRVLFGWAWELAVLKQPSFFFFPCFKKCCVADL